MIRGTTPKLEFTLQAGRPRIAHITNLRDIIDNM